MKTFLYYLTIFLSTACIALVFLSSYMILCFVLNDGTTITQAKLYLFLWGVGLFVLKPLGMLRRSLRDEVEYGAFGESKKDNFSSLSSSERKRLEKERISDVEHILDTPTLKSMTHKGAKDPQKEMDALIGLAEVRKEMHKMASRMEYEREKNRRQKTLGTLSSMHMVFMGAPGTGKTTVARIMTGFLYKNHYIKKNQCIEVDGSFLTSSGMGDSAKKTKLLITKSMGGVLFIDEAYAIMDSPASGEIIATLVKAMEDHKNDIIFIFAGYDKEMRALISTNPGLESRVKRYFWFADFDIADLRDIFLKFAGEEGFVVSGELMEAFSVRIAYEKKQKNFGNARTVRNLLDQMIDIHATNIVDRILPEEKRFILCENDLPKLETHKHI